MSLRYKLTITTFKSHSLDMYDVSSTHVNAFLQHQWKWPDPSDEGVSRQNLVWLTWDDKPGIGGTAACTQPQLVETDLTTQPNEMLRNYPNNSERARRRLNSVTYRYRTLDNLSDTNRRQYCSTVEALLQGRLVFAEIPGLKVRRGLIMVLSALSPAGLEVDKTTIRP